MVAKCVPTDFYMQYVQCKYNRYRGTQCAECCRLAVLRLEAAFLVKLVGFILGFFPAAG